MGRQSQQRISNQHKRAFQLASKHTTSKRRKGDQLTIDGKVAFESTRDCQVCRAHHLKRFSPEYRVPKRAHHVLCIKNKKTFGKGELSTQTEAGLQDDRRYRALITPIRPEERGSAKYLTAEAGAVFFSPRQSSKKKQVPMADEVAVGKVVITAEDLNQSVGKMTSDPIFCEKHASKSAPLAMIAFANAVTDTIIQRKDDRTLDYFDGLTMVVPPCNSNNNPHYHSIVGQKLLLVDWGRLYGLQLNCPDTTCPGVLRNDRTNFSKNKTLFPIFGLDGPPSWCIVMTVLCPCCHRRFHSNEGSILLSIPDYAADAYPVETNYALSSTAGHLARNATEVFSSLMVTYGNGEMCSKLLFNAINRAYLRRIKVYYSKQKNRGHSSKEKNQQQGAPTEDYIEKDGVYIKQFPPLGSTIRNMYDAAASSDRNPWRISDTDRNTREIQAVGCTGIFAQDHTFQVTKNYQNKKKLGAAAVWDVATGTGEIASAVLVRSTKTEEFAHAAQHLMRRPNFNPKVMYSDTWPHMSAYWNFVCPEVEGRLGLFHYEKRIISTLKKKHVDYLQAITDLLGCLYAYHPPDYEKLLSALKNGTLSGSGKKYSSNEITQLQGSTIFRDRYAKYLRKQVKSPETII